MKINRKHFAKIDESGHVLRWEDGVAWKQSIMSNRGKRVQIVMSNIVKHRSNKENRYFHGVVCPMFAEKMGCTMEEAKNALKIKFLNIKLPSGLWTTKQTSSLSTVEFETFMSQCRQLASEMFDLFVPLPNEVEY